MRRALLNAALSVAAAALALVPSLSSAATPEEFYKGRPMTLIMSADAGGGYASYANAFAPYLSAHIPGKPRITVQYMPGAGGLRAMNYLYNNAPKDGSVIGMVHSSVPYAPLYGLSAARFDPRKFGWLGSIDQSTGICVAWATSGIRTWQDMMAKGLVVGSSGAGSQMETMPMMLNKLFGSKNKVISGYKGGNEVYLAMERGEVQGRCGSLVSSINSTRPDWFPQKKVVVPITIALERNPMFPDVPARRRVRQGRAHEAGARACAVADGDGPALSDAARRACRPLPGAARGVPCGGQRSGFPRRGQTPAARGPGSDRREASSRSSRVRSRCRPKSSKPRTKRWAVSAAAVSIQLNIRVARKMRQPAIAPTTVPFMRMYCRSLPTTSSRRSVSTLVSQLFTTSEMNEPIALRQEMM